MLLECAHYISYALIFVHSIFRTFNFRTLDLRTNIKRVWKMYFQNVKCVKMFVNKSLNCNVAFDMWQLKKNVGRDKLMTDPYDNWKVVLAALFQVVRGILLFGWKRVVTLVFLITIFCNYINNSLILITRILLLNDISFITVDAFISVSLYRINKSLHGYFNWTMLAIIIR